MRLRIAYLPCEDVETGAAERSLLAVYARITHELRAEMNKMRCEVLYMCRCADDTNGGRGKRPREKKENIWMQIICSSTRRLRV